MGKVVIFVFLFLLAIPCSALSQEVVFKDSSYTQARAMGFQKFEIKGRVL